ncbi:MAG: hypothetical protein IJX22_03015 [Opitutales bacterium]|nr:hypothetical protein [Opitutales bacterium]
MRHRRKNFFGETLSAFRSREKWKDARNLPKNRVRRARERGLLIDSGLESVYSAGTMKIHINPGVRRMLCLVTAMVLGGSVPVLWRASGTFFDNHAGDFVPLMIMVMLLFSFIDVKFSKESTGWSHVRIPVFMAALAAGAYFLVKKLTGDENFAVMAFLIGMTPTANAAPVITHLLGRREDYVTVSVV